MHSRSGYSAMQIVLHWLIAVLIVMAWITHDGAEEAMRSVRNGDAAGLVPHVAFGLAVLGLVVIRVLVRLSRGAPPAPGGPGSLAVKAADWGHRLIYLLMIAVPLGGAMVWLFGLDVGEIHGAAANLLMLVVLGHSLMALHHHYILKDGLLRRMMRPE